MQPENGGLGVFAHEYGHDLGLPDQYDTSGSGENSVGFWSLMSSGSWLGTGKDAIGDLPGDMNAWDKLQLGWLDYDTAKAATKSTAHARASPEYNTKNPQALVVELPDEGRHHRGRHARRRAPSSGGAAWATTSTNTLTRSVDLTGKSTAALTLRAGGTSRQDYDYLYTEVSTDGGANWTPLDGTADGKAIPRDAGDKPAPDRHLGRVQEAWRSRWTPTRARRSTLRFRYQTDGGVARQGLRGRRDHGDARTAPPVLHRRRRGRRQRLDRERLLPHRRVLHQGLPAVLHRREPPVRLVRHDPEDRPVQLRLRAAPGPTGSSTTRTRTAC